MTRRKARYKACPKCGRVLTRSKYGTRSGGKGYLRSWCKDCEAATRREYGKTHKKQTAAQYKAYREQKGKAWHAERQKKWRASRSGRDSRLRYTYGISLDEYEKLLEKQGGGCAICGTKNATRATDKSLHVDHDHKTGLVRGLLCFPCNRALGSFRDNPDRLEQAAKFLRNPPYPL